MSRLSFWAWGYEDRLPDDTERAQLASLLQHGLGFPPLGSPRAYPRLSDIPLPEPRIGVPASLAGFCTADGHERALRTHGRSFPDIVRGLSGDFASAPDVIAQPMDEAQVVEVLDWATDHEVAVVPYGGGTSVVGGVECPGEGYAGVICLDMRRLDRVLEVDRTSLSARIQAGATGPVLERQLGEHGLTLRHFPQSFELSTLGGWIATRAGGHFATNYTHIDDLVQSVRMVTPSGVWQSRRLPGSGAGPSPDRLVLGSEGTLGVITEAWMRIFERPRYRSRCTVAFDAFDDGVEAVRTIAQLRVFPSNCRLLDPREAMLSQIGAQTTALLAFESASYPVRDRLAQVLEVARAHGGRAVGEPTHHEDPEGTRSRDDDGHGRWRRAFLDMPYKWAPLATLGVIADTFETACTWDRFEALHAEVVHSVLDAMRATSGGHGFVSCRFTHVYPDGPAPYYTFLCPAVGDPVAQWSVIKRAAGDALMRCGATITHHHAVGRVHRPWYDQQRPELFAASLRAVKRELDPSGVLNPGVLIDPA